MTTSFGKPDKFLYEVVGIRLSSRSLRPRRTAGVYANQTGLIPCSLLLKHLFLNRSAYLWLLHAIQAFLPFNE